MKSRPSSYSLALACLRTLGWWKRRKDMVLLGVGPFWPTAVFGLLGFIDLHSQWWGEEQTTNNPYRLCLVLLKKADSRRALQCSSSLSDPCLVHPAA